MNSQKDTNHTTRADTLRDLVELRVPLSEAIQELAGLPWDSDEELVNVTRADAARVLERHIRGELTAEECQQWADALEVRDDVGREPGYEDALTELLFELATPDVAGPLTPSVARDWLAKLQVRN